MSLLTSVGGPFNSVKEFAQQKEQINEKKIQRKGMKEKLILLPIELHEMR